MQTSAKNVPIFLFACSVPFYFFGLFSLHTDRGVKLVGSLRFWQMGLTGDYDPYQQYFYTRLANFAQAVVVLLIFSVAFYGCIFLYWSLYGIKSKTWSWRNGPCLRLRCCVLHSIVRLF